MPTKQELEARIVQLELALYDLLTVIATDQLIPESVSYMRQARAAIGAKKGQVVDHLDGDPRNNAIANLRIVDPKENRRGK